VIYLCSLLPPSSVVTVSGFCLSRLKQLDLPDNVDLVNVENATCYIDALCNWGRGDDLVELINDWISKGKKQKFIFGTSSSMISCRY
jgi:hypothetical protein